MRDICTYVGACIMFGALGIWWSANDIKSKERRKGYEKGFEDGRKLCRIQPEKVAD